LNHYYAEAGSSNEYARYADIVSNISNGAGSKIRFITKNAANTYFTSIIDNAGQFGIGTTSPESKLHVAGDIRVDNAKSILGETNGGGNFQMIKIDTSDNMLIGDGNLVIDINGTSERMKINSVGNVLIGQPTDTVDRLMVQGAANLYAARFNGSTNGGQSFGVRIRAGSNSSDHGFLVENTAGGDLFIVKGNGNVSVGATHVADTRFFVTGAFDNTYYSLAKFKEGSDGVEFTTRSANGRQQIDFLGTNTSSINAKGSLFINYDTNNDGSNDTISFTRNGADEAGTLDMIIKEGNVGIGTDSPATKLQAIGTISGSTGLFENAKISNFNASDYAAFGHENVADNAYAIRQHSNGNVHINCGPSRLIQFRHQNSTQGGFNASKDFFVGPSETNNTFHVDISETNVGVGTYAPLGKLTVATTMSSSPTTQLYLDVDGSNSVGGGGEVIFSTSASAGALDAYNAIVRGQRSSLNDGSSDLTFLTTHVPTSATAAARMTIKDAGNVGIGTDNPATRLQIDNGGVGTVDSAYSLAIRGDGIDGVQIISDASQQGRIVFGDNSDNDIGRISYDHSDDSMSFRTNGSEKVYITSAGNVGIGTDSPSNALDVVGHFSATSKSFLIDHPTKENKKLQYASLEGPENGVYVRGTTNEETIELPEYWSELVHDESITVVLTPIDKKQDLFIIKKSNKLIKIGGVEGSYDYVVYGERKDIEKLEIEPLKV